MDVRVYRLNDRGWVTYSKRTGGVNVKDSIIEEGGFLITNAGQIRVGLSKFLVSDPLGLNEVGDVVGSSRVDNSTFLRGFLYRRGVNYDLNDITFDRHGWILSSAQAINEERWIAATAIKGNQYVAFLLRPLVQGSIRRAAKIACSHVYDGIVGAKTKA
ncbi:MAG: hypothetical protein JSS65_09970 [Armatimonadetes bacterium]|nr:hypothetical protein [Armatimonadota bacterium]